MAAQRWAAIMSPSDEAAVLRTLRSSDIVDEIQQWADARPGPNLSVSVLTALYALIAAAGLGHGFAARIHRSAGVLHDNNRDSELHLPDELLVGERSNGLSADERMVHMRRVYGRLTRTLEAIGIWCQQETDGINNQDRLAHTLLLASTPPAARKYNSYAVDSAGVLAAHKEAFGVAAVSDHQREATRRIRTHRTDSGDKKDKEAETKKVPMFGYGLHVMGRIDPTGDDPNFWIAMVGLTSGSTPEVATTRRFLHVEAMLNNPTLNLFIGDRAYSQSSKLADDIYAMHGDLVHDISWFQDKPQRMTSGIWNIGGGAYDPATPTELLHLPRRTNHEPANQWLAQREALLGPYRLKAHTQPDIDGRFRVQGNCKRAGADCPIRPDLARPGKAIYVHPPADGPNLKLCQGGTVQLDRSDFEMPKSKDYGTFHTYQPLPYGTYEHAAVYMAWRSRTEGAQGTLIEHHGLWGGQHGFKVRNFDILNLFTIASAVAYNLTRRGNFLPPHGTKDRKKEATLVVPEEHMKNLQRTLSHRARTRAAFDPLTCRYHDHPTPKSLLHDHDGTDPPTSS